MRSKLNSEAEWIGLFTKLNEGRGPWVIHRPPGGIRTPVIDSFSAL
jgi:hypothetical protein